MVSDEIYSDANKGTRVPNEKLIKNFKTKDQIEIAKQILEHGDVNLTTDQRRRMVEEKKKQIIQYINRNFIDPKTHLPHPPLRIENAMEQIRLVIDPSRDPRNKQKKLSILLEKFYH